jgi:hypothetical protein
VLYLDVPGPWAIGQVEFAPAGTLTRQLQAARDAATAEPERQVLGLLAMRSEATHFATASCEASTRAAALEAIRASIAVLRLYQRARHRRIDLDRQTFGLPGDIGDQMGDHWETDDRRFVGGGVERLWNVGDFMFPMDDLIAFAADPRFAYLDAALAKPMPRWTDFEHRFVKALRFLNRANSMLEDPIRVVLMAAAVELLLGDEPMQGRSHRVARRAAYLTCRDEPALPRHGPSRPACFYLTAANFTEVHAEMKRLKDADQPNVCSFYLDVDGLSGDRNAVLHEAAGTDLLGERSHRQIRVDDILLTTLEWVTATGASGLPDLDSEIEVAGGALVPVRRRDRREAGGK